MQNPQLYKTILHCCCFVVTRIPYTASNNKISLSLYGKYLAMNLDCDGTWQVSKFHAPLAARILLVAGIYIIHIKV